MSKLREKMIRAMELKNLSKHSQKAYLTAVTGLAKHYHKSPQKISKPMIEDYLLYLKNDKGNAPNSCACVLTGLRFFYNNVTAQHIPIDYRARKKVRKLPCGLTQSEIWRIICAPKNLKHRLMLMTTYSAGLRPSEAIALMGHAKLSTTMIYLHVSRETLTKIPSPLDLIDTKHANKSDAKLSVYRRFQNPADFWKK